MPHKILDRIARPETHQILVMVGWIALIHFVVEAFIMGTLSGWQLSRTVVNEALLDCILLTVLASPPIYSLVAKPFMIAARDAETALAHQLSAQKEQAQKLETTLETLRHSLDQNEELRRRLQRSNEFVAEINERTLQRIGADLHDGPAQLLTYSLLRLGRFAPLIQASSDAKAADDLDAMRSALSDTLTEVRNISRGLSLPQLSAVGLEETIALAVTLHQEQTGTKVGLKSADLPADAPQVLKICVYRVVQESLSNSFKHAGAINQKVAAYMDKQLVLEISDHGPGFDWQSYNSNTGALGLTGMRARVEALGGTLSITTGSGRGTTLTIRVDIEKSRQWELAYGKEV